MVNGTAFPEFLEKKTTVSGIPKYSEISVPYDFLTGVSGILS